MEDKSDRTKKIVLFISLVSNLGILFFFKYANFIADALYHLFRINQENKTFNILLPVGISFYTFQALGYSIDIYRGTVKAERNFITYALFITFFPQLVAGPIERTSHLLPQFKINYDFDYARVTDGLKLAIWGMFKKVVIADTLAIYVDKVYSSPLQYQSITLVLATIFFSFQILCDFSGYSDVAIGCAKVLGFSLNKNFNGPYLAHNVSDFWHRWHISLSTWFKDYVYIPLGGNRCTKPRHYLNIFITFLLSGIWHGAGVTFLLWGAVHGIFQIFGNIKYHVSKKMNINVPPTPIISFLKILFTFICICFAWIFFRANSIEDAFYILRSFTGLIPEIGTLLNNLLSLRFNGGFFATITIGHSRTYMILNIFFIFLIISSDLLTQKNSRGYWINHRPLVIRWVIYYALGISIAAKYLISDYTVPFLYFQF